MAVKVLNSRRRVYTARTPVQTKPAERRAAVPLTINKFVAAETPLLSVLVPTVLGRERKLWKLIGVLGPQVRARKDIELLTCIDSRSVTIGHKRNFMVASAKGEYVVFVDDDDMVSPDYIATIIDGLTTRPDVFCFRVRVEGYGPPKPCRYSLSLTDKTLPHEYQRRPNHLMVWRREIAGSVPFPDVSRGEDSAWAEAIISRAKTEVVSPKILYTYQHDTNDNSATGLGRTTRR